MNTGPRRLRITAMTSARISTKTSATTKMTDVPEERSIDLREGIA